MGETSDDAQSEQRRRESQLREAKADARAAAVGKLLKAADERDVDADERDAVAVRRDRDEDERAFLDHDEDRPYGSNAPDRRRAALARGHAKQDRRQSADDREKLTGDLAGDDSD